MSKRDNQGRGGPPPARPVEPAEEAKASVMPVPVAAPSTVKEAAPEPSTAAPYKASPVAPVASAPIAKSSGFDPPPHHTLCKIVGGGCVTGMAYTQAGDLRHDWRTNELAWFADADVLSLPGILEPVE